MQGQTAHKPSYIVISLLESYTETSTAQLIDGIIGKDIANYDIR